MRTIVDLPREQIEALDIYARQKGISRAAAVRESVAAYLPEKTKKKIDWLKHPAFGSWKGPKANAVEYQRKLRTEWDHRANESSH
jgi:hypothetical protein